MGNPNQMQTAEPDVLLGDVPCCDNVCIPQSRYEQLIRAEMEMEILSRSYQLMGTVKMEPVIDIIFSTKRKCRGKETHDSETGVGDA